MLVMLITTKLLLCRSKFEFELSIAPLDDEEVVGEKRFRGSGFEHQRVVALATARDRDAVGRHTAVHCDAVVGCDAVAALVGRRPR